MRTRGSNMHFFQDGYRRLIHVNADTAERVQDIYHMMPDDDVRIIRRSRRFLLRLPRYRWSKTALRGIFMLR